jgi:hypothetical protein
MVGAVIFETGILANTQNDPLPTAARDRAGEYAHVPLDASVTVVRPEPRSAGSDGGHAPGVTRAPNAPASLGGAAELARNSFTIPQDPPWLAMTALELSPPASQTSWRVTRVGAAAPAVRPPDAAPAAKPTVVHHTRPATSPPSRGPAWRNAPIVTWYGPGFYGRRTACGQRYSRTIIGVAHKTLPCGTLIEFRWGGITAVARVIDRGPYATAAYVFDFSAALACDIFRPRGARTGCFTRHNVQYRVIGRRPN